MSYENQNLFAMWFVMSFFFVKEILILARNLLTQFFLLNAKLQIMID